MKYFLPATLCFSLLLTSCNQKGKTKQVPEINSASTQAESMVKSEAMNLPEKDSLGSKFSVMTFKEKNFSFGEVKEGEIATHDFVFTNTGEIPLIITNAQGSCGCTVPEYPKKPIAPGEEGLIKVKFNSTGFEGEKNKSVTIEANTKNKLEEISFTANVIKKK